jgi:hypothetical protein
MSHKNTIFLIMLLFAPATAQEQPTPLPRWTEEDALQLLAGEDLSTVALFQPLADQELAAPVMEGIELPDPLLLNQQEPMEIPEAELERYFSARPSAFLVDPQSMLTSQESADMTHLLSYHESDSKVNFYVYVFGSQQSLPSHIDAAQLLSAFFAESGPTVLLFYHMGEPARSEIFLSQELYRAVGQAEKVRALQSAVNSARCKSQPLDQLEAFCLQLSNRIYWMEKAYMAGVVAPIEVDEKHSIEPIHRTYFVALREWWREWQFRVILSLAILAVAGLAGLWRRQRRRYRLLTFPAPPRMGAPHGAGVGASISFASNHLPPASQRKKMYDDLDLL